MKSHIVLTVLVLGLVSEVRAEPVTAPVPQAVSLGDAHVQSHLPVALVLDGEIQQHLRGALRAMASGTSSTAPTHTTTDVMIELVWRPGEADQSVIALDAGAVLLPILPHRGETYTYFLRVRDGRGQFEARFPAAPGAYHIQAEVSSGPSILDGSGDGPAGQGEVIPIQVRLARPDHVKDVTLFHRSESGSSWTSSSMAIGARTDAEATWTGSVLRPLGQDQKLEYYVQARGTDGRVTYYGVPDRPHRLKLVPPILPAESDE